MLGGSVGTGGNGHHQSAGKKREKISKALIGIPLSKERCANMSKIKKGKSTGPKSEEMRKKISKTLTGNIPWNKGKKTGPLSKEHKLKIRNGNANKIPWNKGIKQSSYKSPKNPKALNCLKNL